MRQSLFPAEGSPSRTKPAPASRRAQVAELGAASPCVLPSTFKTAWKAWSRKWMSRCGTETGGTHLPHRKRPENDLTVLIHIYLDLAKSWFFFSRPYLFPSSFSKIYFGFRSSGQVRQLCFVKWLLGRRIRVLATLRKPAARLPAHMAPVARRAQQALRGWCSAPEWGVCRSSHWPGTAGAPVRL